MYSYLSFRRQLVKNQAFCFHSGPPTSPLRSYCFSSRCPADRLAARRAEADAGEVAVLVRRVGRLQVVGNVVGDRVLADVVAVPVAREAIAARLDADAQHRAAGEGAGVRAGAADLELLEAAEVEVAGVGRRCLRWCRCLRRASGSACRSRRSGSPIWLPVFEPPTSNAVIWMPGACAMAAQTSRAFGISVSSSLVKLVPIAVVEVSTIGEAPVTVTVSCSVATCSCCRRSASG